MSYPFPKIINSNTKRFIFTNNGTSLNILKKKLL